MTPQESKPTIGPGPAGEGLDEKATPDEIERGDYTQVTKLINDEWEPSRDREGLDRSLELLPDDND